MAVRRRDKRIRPYARIFTTLKNHHRSIGFYNDNDLLALFTRILIEGVERYADRTDDTMHVPNAGVMEMSGKRRIDIARKSLERLADFGAISVRHQRDFSSITIRNFAKRQGLGAPGLQNAAHPTSTSTSTSTSPSTSLPSGETVNTRKSVDNLPESNRLCRLFLDRRQIQFPTMTLPTPSKKRKWVIEMDRLLRLGPVALRKTQKPIEPRRIEEMIFWLFGSDNPTRDQEFWAGNVRGVPKLRKQWAQLEEVKAKSPRKTNTKEEKAVDRNKAFQSMVRRQAKLRGD